MEPIRYNWCLLEHWLFSHSAWAHQRGGLTQPHVRWPEPADWIYWARDTGECVVLLPGFTACHKTASGIFGKLGSILRFSPELAQMCGESVFRPLHLKWIFSRRRQRDKTDGLLTSKILNETSTNIDRVETLDTVLSQQLTGLTGVKNNTPGEGFHHKSEPTSQRGSFSRPPQWPEGSYFRVKFSHAAAKKHLSINPLATGSFQET